MGQPVRIDEIGIVGGKLETALALWPAAVLA
jgi:hypothetical protein